MRRVPHPPAGGDRFRGAIRWVEARQRVDGDADVAALVEEAAARFELPPVARELLRSTVAATPRRRRH